MNAGAYGSDWRTVLLDAVVVGAGRRRGRSTADELDLCYRHSGLEPGRDRRAGALPADAEGSGGDQGRGRRAARTAEGDAADEQAHLRQRVQEPAGRARGRRADRELRAEGPPDRRGGDLGAARELHRERRRRDERRRGRADGRGAAPGARALRGRSSSTRCDSSARSSCRRCREAASGGENGRVAASNRRGYPAPAPAAAPRPAPASALDRRRCRRRRARGRARTPSPARPRSSRCARSTSPAARRGSRRRCGGRSHPSSGAA